MADSVVKLRVDSQEYDAKIRRAAEGVRAFGESCRKTGETVANADKETLEYVQSIGRMDTVAKTSKQQLREFTNALTDLTAQYRALSDQEKQSPFGQAMAASIQQLTERAGQVKDAMADVAASVQNAASDTRLFDQMAQGMSLATAAFQTFQGAAKLVGIEIGDNVEVIAKLQAAMAVTNGLTTIQNALQKQSALMQGVMAARTALATAAQTAFAVATGNATKAQAAFNAVANMNPYVLLASIAAAAGTAILAFAGSTDEATEAEQRNLERTEELRQAQEDFANHLQETVGNAVGDTVARFQILQAEWNNLKSVGEQTQWIKANQSSFAALGLSVRDVNSAYQVFVAQAPRVIAALRAIAEAKALQEVYQEKVKERLKVQYGDLKYEQVGAGSKISKSEADQLGLKYNTGPADYDFDSWFNNNVVLNERGAAKVNQARRLAAGRERVIDVHNMYEAEDKLLDAFIKKQSEAAELQKGLPWFTGGGLGGYSSGKFNIGGGGHRGSGGGTGSGGNTTTQQKSEYDLNNDQIKKLTDEYVNATEERKTAIQGEIKVLQDRNAEIQAMKDEALGKVTGNTNPYGSEDYFDQEISELQAALKRATTKEDREFIKESIEFRKKQLAELTGEGIEIEIAPKGMSQASIDGWIQQLQESLSNKEWGTKDYYNIAANLIDAQSFANMFALAMQDGIDLAAAGVNMEDFWQYILEGNNIPDETWQQLADKFSEQLSERVEIDTKTGTVSKTNKEDDNATWQDKVSTLLSDVSQISSGLSQMGVKVPDSVNRVINVMQGLMSVIEGVQAVIQMFSTSSQALNTAAVSANTVAIGTLTAAVATNTATNFIPFFAGGGIAHAAGGMLTGHHFSGDQVPVMCNDGELILSRAQQGVIADGLRGSTPTIQVEGVISGENIRLVQRNNNRRTGRGEYVTTKTR